MDAKDNPSSSGSCVENPILMLLLFQKAMRVEIERVAEMAEERGGDPRRVRERWGFVAELYRHHCNAEDEVIFVALDARVKNVASTYFLEHKGESDLFRQLSELLCSSLPRDDSFQRELASHIRAVQTSLCHHMSKEEEQIFPLLTDKFSFKEQAALVWQFICSIPVNMLTEFLPLLSSSITADEHQDMLKCFLKVVPEEKLLQQVMFTWIDGRDPSGSQRCKTTSPSEILSPDSRLKENQIGGFSTWRFRDSGKRTVSYPESSVGGQFGSYPINEILHWHYAIKRELEVIAEGARKIKNSGDFSDLSSFNERLQFIIDVCIFHSIAEVQVIFPAVGEVSFLRGHVEEESPFNKFRNLVETMQKAGAHSTSAEFYSKLCSYADQMIDIITKQFHAEEVKVLPSLRLNFSQQKQRELLYESICVMPLKFLERILPWFVASLSLDDAKSFLLNMKLSAPSSHLALVTLLCGWACKGRCQDLCKFGSFVCPPLEETGGLLATSSNHNEDCCSDNRSSFFKLNPCDSPSGSFHGLSLLQKDHSNRPLRQCNAKFLSENDITTEHMSIDSNRLSREKQSCCIPDLGFSTSNLGIGPRLCLRSYNFSAPIINSDLSYWETDNRMFGNGVNSRPIDCIFKFHLAIRKDLEYLDVESEKLIGCDNSFLGHFIGKFRLLRSLYKAHSNAEDDIVFPAMESKEALRNVSHSYAIDHKQEEKLFEDISYSLLEFSHLHEKIYQYIEGATTSNPNDSSDIDSMKKYIELAEKLQGMCKSIRVTLDQHLLGEELELWPLFDMHFSVEEQQKIVGRIIGRTGAEVLQSMLPWVTSPLSQEEQTKMIDTWRQATRNTMFNEWLEGWWKNSPSLMLFPSVCGHSTETHTDDNIQQNKMFEPRWMDISQMNQIELESEIRKVSRDTTLEPRKKAYLIQNLMTSRWIAAQHRLPQEGADEDATTRTECSPSYRDPERKIYGCEHYKRNCKLVAACCNKLFTCRLCHDEVSDHLFDRRATTEMMCMHCLKIQPIGPTCSTPSCDGFSMAKYYCNICKFFDDERLIYHCPFCNLCRVGKGLGIDFFHCMTCNCCYAMKRLEHKCRENSLETNCPICYEFLFTSNLSVSALPCGHFMHTSCFQSYTRTHYACPICSKSLGDMEVYFGMLDALLASEVLPEEYLDCCQDILCHDCSKKGKARFHWIHHKCSSCGSYNTRVIKVDADCS